MRKNDKPKRKAIKKNLTRDKLINTCPASYWNEEMNVDNAFEFDVDLETIDLIWREYERDVRPHLKTGNSTEDFCLVTPYYPDTVTWEHDDGVIRSDIKVSDKVSTTSIYVYVARISHGRLYVNCTTTY